MNVNDGATAPVRLAVRTTCAPTALTGALKLTCDVVDARLLA